MKKERFKLTPATHLIFIMDGKVLLSRRANTGWRDGFYSLPGGHLDGKETAIEAAIREGKEEIGLNVEEKNLEFAHVIHRISDGVERVDFFFLVKGWKGEIKNMEPNKCDDLKWLDVGNLPKNTVNYVRQAIENILRGKFYSEEGWDGNT